MKNDRKINETYSRPQNKKKQTSNKPEIDTKQLHKNSVFKIPFLDVKITRYFTRPSVEYLKTNPTIFQEYFQIIEHNYSMCKLYADRSIEENREGSAAIYRNKEYLKRLLDGSLIYGTDIIAT